MMDSDSDDVWSTPHDCLGGIGTATTRHGAPHRFNPTPKSFKNVRKEPMGFVDFKALRRRSKQNKAPHKRTRA